MEGRVAMVIQTDHLPLLVHAAHGVQIALDDRSVQDAAQTVRRMPRPLLPVGFRVRQGHKMFVFDSGLFLRRPWGPNSQHGVQSVRGGQGGVEGET